LGILAAVDEVTTPPDDETMPTSQSCRIVADRSSTSDVGAALPSSTPLEETDSDLLVKLEREKLQDSDERMEVDEKTEVGEAVQSPATEEVDGKETKMEVEEAGKEKSGGIEADSKEKAEEKEAEEEVKTGEKEAGEKEKVADKREVADGSERASEGTGLEETDADAEEEKESDPVVLASRQPLKIDESIGELEKTYGVLMLGKVLGLLTAILPQDMTVSSPLVTCGHVTFLCT
jgi:hypothetical protein